MHRLIMAIYAVYIKEAINFTKKSMPFIADF
jgi:hypothetical protein